MMPTVHMRSGVVCGLILAVLHTASPVFTLAAGGAAVLVLVAGRGLSPLERRRLTVLLMCAFGLRALFIAGVLVSGIPYLNDLSIGGLRGDDAYYLGRAIRARDIAVGLTQGKYDYFVVTDEYGRTSYLQLLTVFQILFGPTPYGMRAFNALLFVAGAVMLFRLVRPGFGSMAAYCGLTVLLFLPSLFVSSVSLLKEPAYFLVTTVLLWCAATIFRRASWHRALIAVAIGGVCLLLLDDLRRGALVLALAGLGAAGAMLIVFANARRAVASIALALVIAGVAWSQPPVRARIIDGITAAAKTHAGHVFTSGHAYKLLDEGFYMIPGTPSAWPITLTDDQALRFVVRAATSFVVTPLPWEMASLSELAFFPEHVVWWLIVVLAPIGVAAGWRRDRAITALLVGFVLPTAAALAVTNGNVGTLLRLRGLVTPYLIWLAALGALTVAERLLAPRPTSVLMPEPSR